MCSRVLDFLSVFYSPPTHQIRWTPVWITHRWRECVNQHVQGGFPASHLVESQMKLQLLLTCGKVSDVWTKVLLIIGLLVMVAEKIKCGKCLASSAVADAFLLRLFFLLQNIYSDVCAWHKYELGFSPLPPCSEPWIQNHSCNKIKKIPRNDFQTLLLTFITVFSSG